jgi:transposase
VSKPSCVKTSNFPRNNATPPTGSVPTIQEEGYQGSESTVRHAITALKKAKDIPEVFLPLEFDPGQDAQVDWGEAWADIAGRRQKVQMFIMRLCYSRRTFAMVFPTQKQESFLWGHVQAFHHFEGVPHRISYDNLGTAVKLTYDKTGKAGRHRQEVKAFIAFRSHYLFSSHFCAVGEGHEKGQVESAVGYTRRNALVPLPEASTFADLNRQLLQRCYREDQRRVSREVQTIGEAWEAERAELLPLPRSDYECCDMRVIRLTPYSQATYETNRYSVPVNQARREVTRDPPTRSSSRSGTACSFLPVILAVMSVSKTSSILCTICLYFLSVLVPLIMPSH